MNYYATISVYASAKDNTGNVMTLAEFMNLGKEKYSSDIIEYRTMKDTMNVQMNELEELKNQEQELSDQIEKQKNPLGGYETEDVVRLKNELDRMRSSIIELEEVIQRAKLFCDEKKRKLPCATLSGWFKPTRAKKNLQEHSGFLCIDIDDHFNINKKNYKQDLTDVPDILASLPWVLYAAHSAGGVGYFALVPIGPIDDTRTHEWYFDCLKDEFERMGIVIDPACRDITRLRFCSYDPYPIRRKNCETYIGMDGFVSRNDRKRQDEEAKLRAEVAERMARYASSPDKTLRHVELCIEQIEARSLDITQDYAQCVNIGRSFYSLGDAGLDLWKRVCRFRSDAHTQMRTAHQLEYKWRSFAKTEPIDIGYFFNICKDYNIFATHNNKSHG